MKSIRQHFPLYFICLGLLVFSFGCTEDEDEAPKHYRLTKVTQRVDPYYSGVVFDGIRTLRYNPDGTLAEFTFYYRDGEELKNTFLYNPQGNLESITTPFDVEVFTYDAQGRIATSKGRSIHNYAYEYGPDRRMTAFLNLEDQPISVAVVTDFDAAGNVVKEEVFRSSPSKSIRSKIYTYEYSYDNKKSPLKGMTSPVNVMLGIPSLYKLSSISNSAFFYSPNNITKVKRLSFENFSTTPTRTDSITVTYEYNAEGYPAVIRFGNDIQELEYSFL